MLTCMQGKFTAWTGNINTYAKATAETVAVRNISAMWDSKLEGMQP